MSLHIGVHRTTADPTWRTPGAVYADLDREFRFTLDPCPSGPILVDGLTLDWSGRVFVNPPYGRAIADWMRKIVASVPTCEVIVALVPCRTDTAWWHDYSMKADEIRFVRGRLSFEGVHAPKGHNAPFPSVSAREKPDRCICGHHRYRHREYPRSSSWCDGSGEWTCGCEGFEEPAKLGQRLVFGEARIPRKQAETAPAWAPLERDT